MTARRSPTMALYRRSMITGMAKLEGSTFTIMQAHKAAVRQCDADGLVDPLRRSPGYWITERLVAELAAAGDIVRISPDGSKPYLWRWADS